MSYQEIAKNMIDRLPDDKLVFVINILENIGEMAGVNLYPEFKPNAETIAAMEELDKGGGTLYTGSTAEVFAMLDNEEAENA
mgnify:CR=1 FL=1